MVTILLDAVVAALLGATILYAIRLDRRLNALRQGRGEMQALLLGIQEMTARAEAGIAQFRTLPRTAGRSCRRGFARPTRCAVISPC